MTSPKPSDIHYAEKIRTLELPEHKLPGINLDLKTQLDWIHQLSQEFTNSRMTFPKHRNTNTLYYFENDWYSYSDALIFSSMILKLRPHLIIEIGSGYSSCVAIDTIKHIQQTDPQYQCRCIFIEPNPQRLRQLLNSASVNLDNITIIEQPLQNVDEKIFNQLTANDILFVDSSHMSQIGSDVNMEVFRIYPRVNQNVYIHIHDMFWPFEYPQDWIKRGWYWNEQYLIRAFLQYNTAFEIVCFLHYLWIHAPQEMESAYPLGKNNFGGGLWLKKV